MLPVRLVRGPGGPGFRMLVSMIFTLVNVSLLQTSPLVLPPCWKAVEAAFVYVGQHDLERLVFWSGPFLKVPCSRQVGARGSDC